MPEQEDRFGKSENSKHLVFEATGILPPQLHPLRVFRRVVFVQIIVAMAMVIGFSWWISQASSQLPGFVISEHEKVGGFQEEEWELHYWDRRWQPFAPVQKEEVQQMAIQPFSGELFAVVNEAGTLVAAIRYNGSTHYLSAGQSSADMQVKSVGEKEVTLMWKGEEYTVRLP